MGLCPVNHLFAQLKDLIKIVLIFTVCTGFFYFALKMFHEEYEQQHRYDPPGGSAVKVFQPDTYDWTERLSIFFQLGE